MDTGSSVIWATSQSFGKIFTFPCSSLAHAIFVQAPPTSYPLLARPLTLDVARITGGTKILLKETGSGVTATEDSG